MTPRTATSDVFQAIVHPLRRQVLEELAGGEMPAMDLARGREMSAPALSQHLKVLKEAGLVSERRAGRRRLYRLNPEPLAEVADWLTAYEQFWTQKLDALGAYLRREDGKEK